LKTEAEIEEKLKQLEGIIELTNCPEYIQYIRNTENALNWVLK